MTVTSAIYMLYVFKERVDVELATKAMVSSAKRVSSVWKSILLFFFKCKLILVYLLTNLA